MERGVLARLYRRLGPRYPGWALAAALGLQYGVFVGTIGVLQIYVRMSLVEFAEVLAVVLALQTLYDVVMWRFLMWRLRPLRRWMRGERDAAAARAAWEAAASVPGEFVRQEVRGLPVVGIVIATVFIAWRLGLSFGSGAIVFAGALVTILYASALLFLVSELLLVPALTDVAEAVPADVDVTRRGVPLLRRLLLAIPAINVVTGVVVSGLAQHGHAHLSDLGLGVVLALAVTLTISLVLVFLLSSSVVVPIGHLRAATERVRGGDFDTRVPVVSSDETAELARSFNEMVAGLRERERLHEAFGAFVDPGLTERVLRDGTDLAGEEVEVSILFVDVRGFTAFAERATARDVVARLNDLFEAIVPVVLRHGGHASKFFGDGLMAVFGAPERIADHADRAVAAAIEVARLVRERFAGELRVGVGVNSGPVVAGTIGGGGRVDFTVIGDAVNTAARVESATRSTGDDVLVTGATRGLLTRDFGGFDPRPPLPLKGKSEDVELYAPRALVSVPLT